MRLIDVEALIEFIENRYEITWKDDYEGGIKDACTDILEKISKMPTIEPERKKGKWIKLDMHAHLADHKCTACGQECYVPTCMGEPMYTYCPNCGADMREDQHDQSK